MKEGKKMKKFLITFFGILALLNLEVEMPYFNPIIKALLMLGTLLFLFVISIILGIKKKISKIWILYVFLVILYLVIADLAFFIRAATNFPML